jgi:hypothetical protein
MSEIIYFKVFYYVRYGPIVGRRCKLVYDMAFDDVDSLHVKRITLND